MDFLFFRLLRLDKTCFPREFRGQQSLIFKTGSPSIVIRLVFQELFLYEGEIVLRNVKKQYIKFPQSPSFIQPFLEIARFNLRKPHKTSFGLLKLGNYLSEKLY